MADNNEGSMRFHAEIQAGRSRAAMGPWNACDIEALTLVLKNSFSSFHISVLCVCLSVIL